MRTGSVCLTNEGKCAEINRNGIYIAMYLFRIKMQINESVVDSL